MATRKKSAVTATKAVEAPAEAVETAEEPAEEPAEAVETATNKRRSRTKAVETAVEVVVKRRFRDKETGRLRRPGEVFEATPARLAEIRSVDAGLIEER